MNGSYPPSRYLVRSAVIGQADRAATPAEQEQEAFTIANLARAIQRVTPSLIIVGVATGASFAIGSWLVARYLPSPSVRRRR